MSRVKGTGWPKGDNPGTFHWRPGHRPCLFCWSQTLAAVLSPSEGPIWTDGRKRCRVRTEGSPDRSTGRSGPAWGFAVTGPSMSLHHTVSCCWHFQVGPATCRPNILIDIPATKTAWSLKPKTHPRYLLLKPRPTPTLTQKN